MSDVEKSPITVFIAVFSGVEALSTEMSVGASFTFCTNKLNVFSKVVFLESVVRILILNWVFTKTSKEAFENTLSLLITNPELSSAPVPFTNE